MTLLNHRLRDLVHRVCAFPRTRARRTLFQAEHRFRKMSSSPLLEEAEVSARPKRQLDHSLIDCRLAVSDYSDIYPEDPYGAEAGENARVWRVYLDESGQFDDDMLQGFRDSLDVHLIFVRCLGSLSSVAHVERV